MYAKNGQFCQCVLSLMPLQTHKTFDHFKAAVHNFFGGENDPKSIFEQVHNKPVFKTIALL